MREKRTTFGPAPIKHKIGEPYKVRGNKELGWTIAIPYDAYIAMEQPLEFTCVVLQGSLIYQPVRP